MLPLDTVNATLQQQGRQNNNFSGTLYVATPALLADFGIRPSQVDPGADIVSMRPGLGSVPDMQLIYGDLGNPQATPSAADNPKIQQLAALPSVTSAPNTLMTPHAIQRYKLQTSPDGWFIQAPQPLTSAQISSARQIAANAGVTVETSSVSWGSIRSATAPPCSAWSSRSACWSCPSAWSAARPQATCAPSPRPAPAAGFRRSITSATACVIGLLGAILGAAGATAAGVAWARSSLTVTFGDFPVLDLLAVLAACRWWRPSAAGCWPAWAAARAIARQPLE